MNNFEWQMVLLVILLAWLFCITLLTLRLRITFNRLVQGLPNKKGNLSQVLEQILLKQQLLVKDIAMVSSHCDTIEKRGLKHIQKVSIVRFNPFDDVGGDQSFCIAFLDAGNNGMVVSSLHSRQGTRIYAKPIQSGQAAQYQLSQEEQQAVKAALATKES